MTKKKQKVWHVSRFRQRYELADNVRFDRKTPLLYTKDFVRPSDEESCAYHRSLMTLRSKSNWLEIRGAFAELKNYAGNMGKSYRGYLLNNKFEPASIKEIGRWLGINGEKKAKEIIYDLEDVGLLELVDMPVFDTDDDGPAKGKSRGKSPSKKKKAKKKASKKKTSAKQSKSSTDNSVRARENTAGARARTRKSCSSLKKKAKAKAKVNGKGKDNANNGNDKNTKEINKRLRKDKSKAQEAPPTKTTQPIKPKVSATLRGSETIMFPTPSKPVKNTRDPERIGDVIRRMEHRYDQDAKKFGCAIYRALKLPWDPASAQGRRELGCFASVWMKAKNTDIPPPVLDELWSRAVEEARKVAKRWHKCSKVGAVWCTIFNNLVEARKRRAM